MLLDAMNGSDLELTDFDYVSHSKTYLTVYEEDKTSVKKKLIEHMMDYILNCTNTKTAEEYAWNLRRYYEDGTYKVYIEDEIERMYDKRFFPIGDIDFGRFRVCEEIMFILYCNNRERFMRYCNELKKQSDRMSGYRIDLIINNMEEE